MISVISGALEPLDFEFKALFDLKAMIMSSLYKLSYFYPSLDLSYVQDLIGGTNLGQWYEKGIYFISLYIVMLTMLEID